MQYATGELYFGSWVNDKKQGQGDFIGKNRDLYRG